MVGNVLAQVVPGSHRDMSGNNLFHEGADLMAMVDGEPGLVAVCAPPGTCMLTDTRMLHCGGQRAAPGSRYALRIHYNRYFMRIMHEQGQQNLHLPPDVWDKFSPRLRQMMGVSRSITGLRSNEGSRTFLRVIEMQQPQFVVALLYVQPKPILALAKAKPLHSKMLLLQYGELTRRPWRPFTAACTPSNRRRRLPVAHGWCGRAVSHHPPLRVVQLRGMV